MSKKLKQKIIEAGIVPTQAVKLLKHWRCLEDDMPEAEQEEKTVEQLMGFIEDIGAILEEDAELPENKETALDMDKVFSDSAKPCTVVAAGGVQNLSVQISAMMDRNGDIIFKYQPTGSVVEAAVRCGNRVAWVDGSYEIMGVEPRYQNDELAYLVCSVERLPNAVM